ncbi:TraB/GumN family protein [Methylopila musalis]|uniref:TraB/GumN family protein n=1 Tax=Methylopila musalis TaxID=1134781 RepID=A0ABW3Z584_9HYPH
MPKPARALRLLLAAGLLAFSGSGLRAAEVCGGEDLLARAAKESGEAYAAFVARAQEVPNGEGLLWKVEPKAGSSAAPSYLFGTMHTTEADLVELAAPVRDALKSAKTVAVEVENVSGAAVQAETIAFVTKNGLDLSGGGLAGFTETQKDEVGKRLAASGLPASLATTLKPWFLSVALQLPACEVKLMGAGKPTIDSRVEAVGREQGAAIVGLETVAEQLGIVAGMPEEDARRMIRDVVASPNASEDLRATVLRLYRDRKIGWYLAMTADVAGPLMDASAYAAFMEELVDRRNVRMAERSEALIDTGAAFVAVGALHLPGPKGLVELYRKAGYTVTKVW